MRRPGRYSPEVRERAVRMVREHAAEHEERKHVGLQLFHALSGSHGRGIVAPARHSTPKACPELAQP